MNWDKIVDVERIPYMVDVLLLLNCPSSKSKSQQKSVGFFVCKLSKMLVIVLNYKQSPYI